MVVYTLAFVSYLSVMSFSQMAPFYPLEAKDAGINIYYVGFVIGINAIFFMLTCVTIGKFLTYLGRENAIVSGLIFITIQQFLLAYISTIQDDPDRFLRISFVAQAIGGIGSGLNSVSSMALNISYSTKQNRDQNIGLMEGFIGLGFLTGPLVGSVMYSIGGYTLPFLASGSIQLFFTPICMYNLYKARKERDEQRVLSPQQHDESAAAYNTFSLIKVISVTRFLLGILSQIMVTGSIQFLAPSLSLALSQFGYSPEFTSICFCIPSVLYAGLSPFMFMLTERLPKRMVILIGFMLMSCGMALVGQSNVLGLDADADFVLLGLVCIGIAAAMVAIPVMPECLEAIEEAHNLNFDPDEVNNEVAGIFVTATGVGEAIGPIVSSMLNHHYGFTIAQDYMASFLLCYLLIYFFLGGGFSICKVSKTEKERYEISKQGSHFKMPETEIV